MKEISTSIVLRLDPRQLANPDLDIRYELPDLLVKRSGGALADDGYDYVESDVMLLFLKSDGSKEAVETVLEVVKTESILGNRLADSVVVALEGPAGCEVVYPPDYEGEFVVE